MYIEGVTDQALPEALGVANRSIISLGGIGNVINKVAKEAPAIGIIDEDPGYPKPSLFGQFYLDHDARQHKLKFYRNSINSNLLIVLSPKLEPWILSVARLAKVDITKHGLSNKPDQLRVSLRNNNAQNQLSRLFKHLVDQNNATILYLQDTLIKEYVRS